jgi:hypothetical protein
MRLPASGNVRKGENIGSPRNPGNDGFHGILTAAHHDPVCGCDLV